MMGLKKKRRIRLIVIGLALLAAATTLAGYGFRDGIELFRSPSQITANPPAPNERFQLGGMVKLGSWVRGTTNSFIITDFAEEYPVSYEGMVPANFCEGQATIVTGIIENGVLVASKVLAKHDEKYLPKEVADTLKGTGIVQPSCGS